MKKTVLITGASSGFGRETAKLFSRQGWNVAATMRSPEKETELTALDNVLVTKLDVTDNASIQNAVAQSIARFGQIDVLVNNAGYGAMGALETAGESQIRQQFEVNLFGLIETTKAVLPGMRAQQSGVIINVSSIGGRLTFPFSSLYHATKFAVEGLTESLQYELNPLGIRLKLVEPGGYKTEFAGRSMDVMDAGELAEYSAPFKKFMGMIDNWPMSANIAEVAEVIYEAATDGTERLRYLSGSDAEQVVQARQQLNDIDFKKMMAAQTGL
ncbi:short-chain dehydrogenase/reductase [Mucilaginibacter sp. PPCGB 2223]|uniref:SDR family oxidoreductase n=1 Tax=Mucilaginibacter sp. PPCGB 2223 TaxID=1886027 RepID=UPI000825314E|nr:SDR family oxidoreductase [Mucilaginibacter sp. PPCGB 2223]OCX51619.1 short-chain dehydrogenase/reductase [Mucilaginibacter sp. PPCGB 2223]